MKTEDVTIALIVVLMLGAGLFGFLSGQTYEDIKFLNDDNYSSCNIYIESNLLFCLELSENQKIVINKSLQINEKQKEVINEINSSLLFCLQTKEYYKEKSKSQSEDWWRLYKTCDNVSNSLKECADVLLDCSKELTYCQDSFIRSVD